MPVHLGNHWTCAVIDLAAQELVYYDSMGVRFKHRVLAQSQILLIQQGHTPCSQRKTPAW